MVLIPITEAPGFEGLKAITQRIKASVNPDPWGDQTQIVLEGTPKALRLMRLFRFDQIPGVSLSEP